MKKSVSKKLNELLKQKLEISEKKKELVKLEKSLNNELLSLKEKGDFQTVDFTCKYSEVNMPEKIVKAYSFTKIIVKRNIKKAA